MERKAPESNGTVFRKIKNLHRGGKTVNSIYEQEELIRSMMDLLERQFGSRCEVVLHDLTKDYNHTIVDIRNGYLTGRKVGDSGTNLGLEVLSGTDQGGNRFNYVLHTRDGKIFRSSSVYFHNDEGKVIGSLCVNLDITETIRFEEYLKGYNQYDMGDAGNASGEEVKEIFVNDVTQIIDFLFHEGVHKIGCQPKEMNREQKMEFLRFLDRKGAFLISKSNERVCDFLQISKFTLYNYLDAIRNGARGTGSKEE